MANKLAENLLLSTPSFLRQKDYWLTRLSSEEESQLISAMPLGGWEPAYSVVRTELPEPISKSMLKTGNNTSLPVFLIQLSAVLVLIKKYTGRSRNAVLTPVNINNSQPGTNQYIIIQEQISDALSFKELLINVSKLALSAYQHQDYPLQKILEQMDVPQDSRLSRVICQMDDLHGPVSIQEPRDIAFHFKHQPDRLEVSIRYDVNYYGTGYIEQLARHFTAILEAIHDDLGKPVGSIQVLDDQELQELLHNAAAVDLPAGTFVSLFEKQVEQSPDSIAVACNGNALSYRTLNERANRLANVLSARAGIEADDLVAIMMDRSSLMMESILAVWKSGGAYLPLDPSFPAERLEAILQQASPKLIITDQRCASLLDKDKYGSRLVIPDTLQAELEQAAAHNLPRAVLPHQLAYVIYTSGSTGTPKGVMIEHLGMLNHLCAKIADLGIDNNSIVVQNASHCFDISVWQFFAALLTGGKTLITDDELVYQVGSFLETIEQEKVTILEVVPSYLNVMLDYLENKKLAIPLAFLVATGETLKPELTRRWFRLYPAVPMVNAYGPTEAADDITHGIFDKPVIAQTVPVGKPVQNMQVYILNENKEPCPKGVEGDIYVSGPGVGRGYLYDEEKTRAAFSNDFIRTDRPFRMYKTGDRGRYRHDNQIEYGGRQDQQVKINGYRIEMGEIESVLQRVPGIKDAVVRDLKNTAGNKYLCGYYILQPDTALNSEALRNTLEGVLPHYMVPAFLVRISQFPLTKNGKIDRDALPAPRLTDRYSGHPATEYPAIEEKVIQLWRSILDIQEVGPDDHFFRLGGHSLSAVRLIFHLQKTFNVRLSLQTFTDHPTVAELTRAIAQAAIDEHEEILPAPVQESYEVSQSQKRLWIINEMEEEKYIYNIPEPYIFKGRLDRVVFTQAVRKLLERHEILRTTFINAEGVPRQVVHTMEAWTWDVPVIDLTGTPNAEADLKAWVQAEEKYPFDLEKGPLIRTTLLQVEEELHVFLLTLHHIIADGWSLDIMKNDFFALYEALLAGKPDPLPPLTIQYKDYAAWQKQQLARPAFQIHRKYWLDRFQQEIPILDIPIDYPRPAEKSYKGKSIECSLGVGLSGQVRDFSQSSNVTLFMFLLSAVKALMYRYSGQTDMVIGSPIAGRSHQSLENQIGFYVNLLPIRTSFEANVSFVELLQLVKRNALEAYEHQHYPFDLLIEELALERDLSRSPLFDVLVVLQNTDIKVNTARSIEGVAIDNFPLERSVVKYDLSFNFSESENDIQLSFEYNDDLFSPSSMERLVQHFKNLLLAVIAGPTAPLVSIDYLEATEKETLLNVFNDTARGYPANASILELLQAQAARSPQLTALKSKEGVYSYQELHSLTNQIANYLVQEKQVGPGDTVAIRVERCAFSVIAMLAILKTGACYVPIETQLPDDRVVYILNDLHPKLFIAGEGFTCPGNDSRVNTIQPEHMLYGSCSDAAPPVAIQPDAPSYIIYTSGSTGHPKGVVQTHRTLFNLIRWQMTSWKESEGLRFLQYSSFGFDASIHDILYALSIGGELYLLDEDTRADFVKIKEILIAERIEVIWFTFSALAALFAEIEDAFDALHLKHIVTTGEAAALNNKLGEYLAQRPEVVLHNFYGPSETHVITAYDIPGGSRYEPATVPIGVPIDNTRILILNEQGMLQPVGIPGEIYTATDGLFAGYWHQPSLTEQCLIPHPYDPQAMLYKTGDFGRWRDDGNIAFLGRKDHQVKIRGFRIELKEIEHCIAQFPGIRRVLVLCHQRANKEKELVSYLEPGSGIHLADLQRYLIEKLPEYMVPVHFIALDAFPINKNGKIDKKALPLPQETGAAEKYVAPSGPTEEKLAAIWSDILGKELISITDNFFKIGGHSLGVTRMASRILKEFNVDINLRKIYKHSSIQELATEIEALQWVNLQQSESEPAEERLLL